MNFVLFFAVAVLVLSAFGGYRKGFFRTAITMSSFLIAMVMVPVISPVVTTYIKEHTKLEQTVYDTVYEFLHQGGEEMMENISFSDFGDGFVLPKSWEQALENLPVEQLYDQMGMEEVLTRYAAYYSSLIIRSVVYVVSVAISYLALRLVLGLTDLFGYIPVLSGLNRLAGLLLGLGRGIVILWMIGLVLILCSGYEWTAPVLAMIKESSMLTFLYRSNLLARLLLPAASAFISS